MVFEQLSVADGLTQNTVTDVHQDATGFLWFATESGLNRYDGYTVTQFLHDRDDPESLASDFIWQISEDDEGNLWLATDGGGVIKRDFDTGRFVHFRHAADDPASLSSDAIRSLAIAPTGMVWVGTRDAGLNRLDPATGKVERFAADALPSAPSATATVFDVLAAPSGEVWAGTSEGLFRYVPDSGTFTRWTHDPEVPDSLSDSTVQSLLLDKDATLWVGTFEGGLNQLLADTGGFRQFRAASDGLAGDYVRDLLEDSAGRLWVATVDGLSRVDKHTGEVATYRRDRADPASLASSYIMSLHEDRGGVLWFGTRGGGVNKWNARSWSFGLARHPELDGALIVSFAEDQQGHLWVGTLGAGLRRLDARTGALVAAAEVLPEPLADNRSMSMRKTRDGALWVGTMTGGLHRIDPLNQAVQRYQHDPDEPASLSANGIMSLHESPTGRLWVGTFGGGVSVIDLVSRAVSRVSLPGPAGDALAGARVTALVEDSWQRLWIATDGDGLFVYDPATNTVRQFGPEEADAGSLGASRLYSLHIDARRRLWVGTAGVGLASARLSAVLPEVLEFRTIAQSNGLSDNVVYGILPGERGDLWLSTNNGLNRYSPDTGEVKVFHASHGLQGEEFNFGAYFAADDGRLFFGGAEGYNVFRAESIEEGRVEPSVVLTGMQVLNTPRSLNGDRAAPGTVALGHRDSVIAFDVAALDFVAPDKNLYSYRLDGFDEGWSSPRPDRRITYTNLDAGRYVLRVRAVSADGAEGRNELAVPVSVQPAPWQTWWAYLGYAAVFAFALWQWMRWQRQRLEREAHIERLSTIDPLTGLMNRGKFVSETAAAVSGQLAAGSTMALLAIDFDHFKRINDSFGHNVGDTVLMALSNRLLHLVHEHCQSVGEHQVARLGGDEFAILLVARDAHDRARTLADAILQHFGDAVTVAGQPLTVTASVGVALFPSHGNDAETLLKHAQTAVHAAKAGGRRTSRVFSSTMSMGVRRQVTLEQELRTAVDEQQFRLYLQPKFDARTLDVVGAEALVRWQHPERGILAPGHFIAIAESSGLITEIDDWVLRAVCARIGEWEAAGNTPVPVSVNFSGAEIGQGDPVARVSSALADAGVDPRWVQIELTETVIMQDLNKARRILTALQRLGCRLAIDDFGTGYSSLAHLKRFPLDFLKIDRSFVRELEAGADDRAICAAIVALGQSLQLKIVAEGVETEAQLKALRELGCDQIQGFLLARPMPAADMPLDEASTVAVPVEALG